MATTKIKRHRNTLNPKPILDRETLRKFLHAHTKGRVRNVERQIDLFYQLLHRSGYNVSLDTFIASLLHDETSVVRAADNTDTKLPAKNPVSSKPGRLPQLSKVFLQFLSDTCINAQGEDEFVMLTSRVKVHQTSGDGTTTKIAVELQDGHVVESVLMRHEGRATLCVSSQVG